MFTCQVAAQWKPLTFQQACSAATHERQVQHRPDASAWPQGNFNEQVNEMVPGGASTCWCSSSRMRLRRLMSL